MMFINLIKMVIVEKNGNYLIKIRWEYLYSNNLVSALIFFTFTPPNSTEFLIPVLPFDPIREASTLGPTLFEGPSLSHSSNCSPPHGLGSPWRQGDMSTYSVCAPQPHLYRPYSEQLGPLIPQISYPISLELPVECG